MRVRARQYEDKGETEGKQEKGTTRMDGKTRMDGGRLGWTAKDLDGSAAKD